MAGLSFVHVLPHQKPCTMNDMFTAEGNTVKDSDDERQPDWQESTYPYRNRMRRKPYEKQKYKLQLELLKL